MNNSRLSKRLERKSKKTFLLSITGIIVILVLIFKLGLPLLINFSSLIAVKNDSSSQQNLDNNLTFVAPPILNSTFTATNSAKIVISGNATAKENVILYLNDAVIDKTNANSNGNFSFKNISLAPGDNNLKAKTITKNNRQSDFSNILYIKYNDKAPALSIDTPSENQTFSKDNNTVNVTGKTDPGVKVTINGFWAIVDDSGKYSYNFQLQNGENTLKVIATDDAGNTTEQDRKVTYNQ